MIADKDTLSISFLLCLDCCLMLALPLCNYGMLWRMTVPSDQGLPASVDFSRRGVSVLQVTDTYMPKTARLRNTVRFC